MIKAEAPFIVGAIAVLGLVVFGFANSSMPTGAKLHGQISFCTGRGKVAPRGCYVKVDAKDSILVEAPFGRAGDVVTLVEMKHMITGYTYYAIAQSGDP
jgi:hypothetical protein